MGTITRNPLVAKSTCGRLKKCAASDWSVGLTLACACFCVLPSSSAQAGFGGVSPASATLAVNDGTGHSDNMTAEFNAISQGVVTLSGDSASNDPFMADPMVRGILLSGSAPASANWKLSDSTNASNASPKLSDSSPLLIPLPTAASAGAGGLILVAVLLGAQRFLRRRLFA
jgi:hypothetical protein